MDDTRTERLTAIAVWSIWIGATIPTYRCLAAVARRGGDLSLSEHVSLVILGLLVVPLSLLALVVGLASIGWAVAGVAWLVRRAIWLIGGGANGLGAAPFATRRHESEIRT